MVSEPKEAAKPRIRLKINMPGGVSLDLGRYFTSFEFKAMINGGYIIKATLYDAHFNLQAQLVREGYFKESRTSPVEVEFQIIWNEASKEPQSATKIQKAILISLKANGNASDNAELEFIAMDPPSWYLNMGDAAGTVWKGRVDQVIRNVVQKYAPDVNVEVSRTVDSDQNKWWMMRQDPKSFLSSLIDWSPSITQNKTQWMVASDGYNLAVKEQASWVPRQRAYYRILTSNERSTIKSWDFLSDNALSLVQTKLLAQGASALSGGYLDRITDINEDKVFVKDKNTQNKIIANTNDEQSFTKPPDASTPKVGWSSVSSIPEIYSAGDLGLRYDQYIDGRPRGMYLNLLNSLLRVKFEVIGHGEWSDCFGLGVDSIFIRWTQGSSDIDNHRYWWMTGNWIVYGFHHRVTRGYWFTDLYCARYDHDAAAKVFPK